MERESLIWATGLQTRAADGTVLDAWYPIVHEGGTDAAAAEARSAELADAAAASSPCGTTREVVTVELDVTAPPASTADVYLRLHALSLRVVRPNEVNLEGIFGLLPGVVWTSHGPMAADEYQSRLGVLRASGVSAHSMDKFPRLLDYVTPPGVRIGDANRVRLGAHLSPGTTVMHEGFVNYNAGTLGTSMVEGRISQGVVIGDGSDIGGGASVMGTLSGGGTHRVSVGERTLLGANAGIGISLGDDCVVEAGLYLTAGTKVVVVGEAPRADGTPTTVKASALSGRSGILYRRNSLTGAVEAVARTGAGVVLNDALHA